ncbi:MAG: radical SAM protein [Candidatus Nitrosotenuis sp.]
MAKLLLVQALFVEQFGVMALAAMAKRSGHDVVVAIGSDDHILQKANRFRPHVVGFSVLTGYQKRYLRLGKLLKESLTPKPVIVFGGPHATFFPEVITEEGVDIVCRGEGEGALLDILYAIDNCKDLAGINNSVIKLNGEIKSFPMRPLLNLDELPFPDREIYKDYPIIYDSDMVTFMAGRGCPYNCSFCFNKEMMNMVKGFGTWVRFRSVDNLIEEIDMIQQKKRIRYIDFHDDTFILNRKWLFEFLDAYANKFSIPFTCNIRADLISLDIAKALKASGCCRVSFGVECGDEKLRNLVLKKNLTDDQIRRAADILHQVGIPFFTFNMMGLPGERFEDALKTLIINIEIGADCAWTSIFQPFPGTELARYCIEKGFLERSISTDDPIDTHTDSLLRQPDIEKVVRLQKFVYLAIKFPNLLQLIKKLVNYNFPRIYYYIHRVSYLIFYYRKAYQLTWVGTLKHAWIAFLHYR